MAVQSPSCRSFRWALPKLAACSLKGLVMALTLFAFDTPNARKITVALEEMGLSYAVQVVDITRDEQFAPDFLKISPNNKIPALVDTDGPDGQTQTVFESGAILIYLAEKTRQFLPSQGAARVAALEWLMFQMGGFGPAPGQVHHFVALKDEADKRYGLQRFMAETLRLYGVMDRRLAEQPFFAGDLSIADFAILGWVWRHPRHQVDLAKFPHVQRWYQSLMARPAVQKGFAVALRRD
jgi:GST-like protein